MSDSSLAGTGRLLLIRHGEVETNYHRVFGGRIDMDLSHLGHRQAHTLAEYTHRLKPDAIYVSPMKRAQQTAAPLLAATGMAAKTLDDLREVDFGAWTGLSWDQVRDRFGVSAFDWLDQLELAVIPGAESAESFRLRIEPCLQQIIGALDGQTVAVICHGGVIRMMISLLLKLPLGRTAHFDVEYGSLTIIEQHPRKTELRLLNFTPWRDLPQPIVAP